MIRKKKNKKPYSKRTDLEKINSSWIKARGLYKRGDFSASIIRAATAVEIAANFIIRQELEINRNIEDVFVDRLLLWANGIQGKIDRLIIPISKISTNISISDDIKTKINTINKERNSIVHSGQFKKNTTAKKILDLSKEVIEELVSQYNTNLVLMEIM